MLPWPCLALDIRGSVYDIDGLSAVLRARAIHQPLGRPLIRRHQSGIMELSQYLEKMNTTTSLFRPLLCFFSYSYQLFHSFAYTYPWIKPNTYECLFLLENQCTLRLFYACLQSKYLDVGLELFRLSFRALVGTWKGVQGSRLQYISL